MKKASFAVACVLGLASAASADDKRLVVEGMVDAPVEEVWKAFTTTEGLKSWLAPHADIELKVGGKMRTHYDPKGQLGDANSIENTILSFDPGRMFSIKATKPPETFPYKNALKEMWTVIYFDEAGPGKTKLTVVSLGFTDDPESKKMREHFRAGNSFTLKQLQKKFLKKH